MCVPKSPWILGGRQISSVAPCELHSRLSYTGFSLFPVHPSSSHAPQMGWQVPACYSLYFAPFNGCRCTHCCTASPRSPQLLIILLKRFPTCHHFHINMICFNCTHRDVQIICCEQLIEFRAVCSQIAPCLSEELESCWVTEVVQDISGISGRGAGALLFVTNGGWNAKGRFAGSSLAGGNAWSSGGYHSSYHH